MKRREIRGGRRDSSTSGNNAPRCSSFVSRCAAIFVAVCRVETKREREREREESCRERKGGGVQRRKRDDDRRSVPLITTLSLGHRMLNGTWG